MADTTGWAINGPVKTPVEDARRLVYGLSGDAHGVASTADLVVRPTDPPGKAVQVSPGSALIASRYASGETYLGSLNKPVTLPVTQTPSSTGRTDLVVQEVLDPWAENTTVPVPSDPDSFDFFPIRIIEGVPSGTDAARLSDVPGYENRTGVVLARLDLPKNFGAVEAGVIHRVADVHTPRRSEVVFARPRIAADDGAQMYLAGKDENGGEYFPGGAGVANQFEVDIPVWATHMIVDARWMSIQYKNNPFGRFWMEFGDEYRAHTWPDKQQYEFATQKFTFNAPGTGAEVKNANWLLMDTRAVAAKLRGKKVTFVFKAGRRDTGATQDVGMTALGGLGCRITFSEGLKAPNLL